MSIDFSKPVDKSNRPKYIKPEREVSPYWWLLLLVLLI